MREECLGGEFEMRPVSFQLEDFARCRVIVEFEHYFFVGGYVDHSCARVDLPDFLGELGQMACVDDILCVCRFSSQVDAARIASEE